MNKIKYFFILLFINCLVLLCFQTSIVSYCKANKTAKTQNIQTSPITEEEENHHEKIIDVDLLLSETTSFFNVSSHNQLHILNYLNFAYPSGNSKILIPPPKA